MRVRKLRPRVSEAESTTRLIALVLLPLLLFPAGAVVVILALAVLSGRGIGLDQRGDALGHLLLFAQGRGLAVLRLALAGLAVVFPRVEDHVQPWQHLLERGQGAGRTLFAARTSLAAGAGRALRTGFAARALHTGFALRPPRAWFALKTWFALDTGFAHGTRLAAFAL